MISGSDAVGFGSAAARRFHGPSAVHRGDRATEPFASRNPAALRRIANGRDRLFVETILKRRAVRISPCFRRRPKPGINRMIGEKRITPLRRLSSGQVLAGIQRPDQLLGLKSAR